jgi:uroporphyrinogen decarboxylase
MTTATEPQQRLPGSAAKRRFLAPFTGESLAPPPIWLMRQAGRYLPEYRQTRAEAGSFLDLCYTPALAAEVTLQPIRRYGFDAAILFSDILVVPDGLGQRVAFMEGEGPILDALTSAADLAELSLAAAEKKLAIVLETVARLRQDLPAETALIGFAGAPWTVATYMVGGRGSPDQAAARLVAYRQPEFFSALIDILVEATTTYLQGQVRAGADVLQIFDSWAGSLPDDELDRWVIEPTRRIVSALRRENPLVPVIGFPRGAGSAAVAYVDRTGVDGVGCDTQVPIDFMRDGFGARRVVRQGNLDPLLLLTGGPAMERRAENICRAMQGVPFIFNLGHGIVPQTPPENVTRLLEVVRATSAPSREA